MNFLKTIKNSIYSPEFYALTAQKSFKQSFGYFLLLILLLTVIKFLTLINPILVETPKVLTTFANNAINCFPKDLELKITNGEVGINAPEPYFISDCDISNKQKENIAVIDTKTPFSAQKLDEYKVVAWLTKDAIFYKKSNYEIRSYSLREIKNLTLNRQVLNSYLKQFSPWIKLVGPILAVITFFGIYFSYSFRLIYLLFLALLIWLLAKVLKEKISYGQSYKTGLYAITLGLIAEFLISLTSRWTHFYGFSFMFTILSLGVVIVNLFIKKKTANH